MFAMCCVVSMCRPGSKEVEDCGTPPSQHSNGISKVPAEKHVFLLGFRILFLHAHVSAAPSYTHSSVKPLVPDQPMSAVIRWDISYAPPLPWCPERRETEKKKQHGQRTWLRALQRR